MRSSIAVSYFPPYDPRGFTSHLLIRSGRSLLDLADHAPFYKTQAQEEAGGVAEIHAVNDRLGNIIINGYIRNICTAISRGNIPPWNGNCLSLLIPEINHPRQFTCQYLYNFPVSSHSASFRHIFGYRDRGAVREFSAFLKQCHFE